MAIASKLNSNRILLFSSSNRAVDHSKTLKFNIASKSLSGLKVEGFKLNSTSNSRTNNNAVAVFHRPVDKFEGISNQFEFIKQAFDSLKSKFASPLMALCLLSFGLMIVCCQRPVLALDFFAARNRNISPKGCLFCSSGCVFCENEEENKEDKVLSAAVFVTIAAGIHLVVFMFMHVLIFDPVFKRKSIFKIQAGLLVDDDLHRDLTLISKALEKSGSAGHRTILADMVEVLDWHRGKLMLGYSSGRNVRCGDGKECFVNLLHEERKRLNKRRLNDEFEKKFVVVTILVAYSGGHKLPSLRKRKDLDRVLQKLQSCNSKTDIQELDILWLQNDEKLTAGQIKNIYPSLKPLDSNRGLLSYFFGQSV